MREKTRITATQKGRVMKFKENEQCHAATKSGSRCTRKSTVNHDEVYLCNVHDLQRFNGIGYRLHHSKRG